MRFWRPAMASLDLIEAAAARLAGHVRQTPLLNAPLLDRIAGRRVLVKAECLQWTGSFKFRGGWSAVSALAPEVRARGVIAYSSGNHAQGVALAAALHGVPAVIVMPADAPMVKIENTRAYGAEVVLYDRETEDRDAIGAAISQARGLTLIRPYDDMQVIAGQGTVGLEIAARAAGSVCDAIVTPTPGELTFPILHRLCGAGLVVTDEQALRAVALAFAHLRIVLEPGGAVALAAALFDDSLGDTVICTGSGGNVDPALFADVLARFPA